MDNCIVLGTGESAHNIDFEKLEEWDSFGVNDVYKIHPVNHLVCVNHPHDFTPERLKIITQSTPKRFYTHLPVQWAKYFPDLVAFKTGHPTNIEAPYISVASTSAFCALIIAIKTGYKNIVLAGVDLQSHKNLSTTWHQKRVKDNVKTASDQYAKKGGKIWVSSEFSILAEVLPIYDLNK